MRQYSLTWCVHSIVRCACRLHARGLHAGPQILHHPCTRLQARTVKDGPSGCTMLSGLRVVRKPLFIRFLLHAASRNSLSSSAARAERTVPLSDSSRSNAAPVVVVVRLGHLPLLVADLVGLVHLHHLRFVQSTCTASASSAQALPARTPDCVSLRSAVPARGARIWKRMRMPTTAVSIAQ